MKPLYQLSADFTSAETRLEELGMDEQTIRDTLDGLVCEFDEKAANIVRMIKNREALVAAMKKEESGIRSRRESEERNILWLRSYLMSNMAAIGRAKIESPEFCASIRANPPKVIINDQSALPQDYYRVFDAPPPEPDRKKIAEALKSGIEVAGATLLKTQRLEIR